MLTNFRSHVDPIGAALAGRADRVDVLPLLWTGLSEDAVDLYALHSGCGLADHIVVKMDCVIH